MNDETGALARKVDRLDSEVMSAAKLLFEQKSELQTVDMKTEFLTSRLEEIAAKGAVVPAELIAGILELLREGALHALRTNQILASFDARIRMLEGKS